MKNNAKRNQLIAILSYLSIWSLSIIVFWFLNGRLAPIDYSILFLWIILPVTTLAVSVIIGINGFRGKTKRIFAFFLFAFLFGVMYMLAEYGTFSLANNIACDKLNPPEWKRLANGAIISAVGMLTGLLFKRLTLKRRNRNKNK